MCHQAYCARLKLICQSNWQLTTIHISLGAFIHSLEDPYCIGWLPLLKKITLKLATLQGVILSNQYLHLHCAFTFHLIVLKFCQGFQ